jgi:hypothetical protein
MKYQIWYMKPEFFRDGIMGKLPNPADLSATHVHLKNIEADGIENAYYAMQGEVWSPDGEARGLIASKGLEHTSMCVGDVLIDDVGNVHVAAPMGFKAIGGFSPQTSVQS